MALLPCRAQSGERALSSVLPTTLPTMHGGRGSTLSAFDTTVENISPDSQDLKLPAPFLHGVKDCCATNFSRFGVLPFTEKWLTWACGVPGERHMLVTIFNGQKLALSRP